MRFFRKFVLRGLSYVLVAAVSAFIALMLWGGEYSKLTELENVIKNNFVGQADMEQARDAAAEAMVDALGDRWSYYISAEDYAAYQDNKDNSYVGVGITIIKREDAAGFDITEVTPGGSAHEQGVLPGDILIAVDGQPVAEKTTTDIRTIVRGEEGTNVPVTVLRNEEELEFTLQRKRIQLAVARGQMLDGGIGLVRIENFNTNCASETIAAVKDLLEQGATKLIFDVRNNPGGYVKEMTKVLDYLLPEGVLFRQEDNTGKASQIDSDKDCLEVPVAVLVNGDSYSAAEFFAAALREYDWAIVVGQQTVGKGYYQYTIDLYDGSAVNLSCGKYFTPKGVNLTEVGGLTPDAEVEVDEQTAAQIASQTISVTEDPQIQAAIEALNKTAE
ncbi:MAG: PDZ domain-containing protein [Oscillospiraceae bacterium]|nr:PDZ domain-containing protein [Oscillospiraceae bacterium]